MSMVRAVVFALFICSVALAACGGAGSGGGGTTVAPATQAPALGTNKPAESRDPYDYGY